MTERHPTLIEVLRELGYSAIAAHSPYERRVVNADGHTVFTGRAYQVWEWLRETKQYDVTKPHEEQDND